MAIWQVWAGGALGLLVLATATWLVSVPRRDASLADRVWGAGFALVAVIHAALGDGAGPRTGLVLVLVWVWGLRRSWRAARRSRGSGEDARYRAMRERAPDSFPVTSLYRVFWAQAGLTSVISLPLLAALHRPAPGSLGWLDVLGAVAWLVGFTLEEVGDRQLARDPADRGEVAVPSRHASRIGTATVWWGFALVALATGAWWAALGPLLITLPVVELPQVALPGRAARAERS